MTAIAIEYVDEWRWAGWWKRRDRMTLEGDAEYLEWREQKRTWLAEREAAYRTAGVDDDRAARLALMDWRILNGPRVTDT